MLERGFKVSPGFVTQVAVTPTYVRDFLTLFFAFNKINAKEYNQLQTTLKYMFI